MLPEGGVLGGYVLSHDQIEAALMRRAGYDVRVLPEEDLGWEENPPTLIEFIRRDQRWCQGTLQYGFFLSSPGLKFVSRFNLAFAMLMFLGSPAWIGLLIVGTLAVAAAPTPGRLHPRRRGLRPARVILVMWFAPKIATVHRCADAAAAPPRLRRHRALSRERRDETRSSSCCRRSCGSATRCSSPACRSAASSAGSARCATITPCPGRRRCGSCGRTRAGRGPLGCSRHPSERHPLRAAARRRAGACDPACSLTAWPAVGTALARIGIGRLPEEDRRRLH
jgi:membrane glycosyltransferase